MNMLYEGLKEKASLIIVPSTAVDTMQLGSVAGLSALSKVLAQELTKQVEKARSSKEKEGDRPDVTAL
jgi:hypothetical protein